MVVLAVLGITLAWLVHAQVSSHQLAESEIGLQRAVRALQNQVEILRVLPYEELTVNHCPIICQIDKRVFKGVPPRIHAGMRR
ncbi:MAG: hypothetical protein GY749_47780 [Desulfobacteraceae bacterium]|nr:hypothetical protein [Desulfobacteraceae bacterium]